MQNLWTVNQYHSAYYGAVSAIERAELTLKYRDPWFEGSGWFFWTGAYGPLSDNTPELLLGENKWLWREVHSRTTAIPAPGMGNTEAMFAAADSRNYNTLWYVDLETILLSYDNTTDADLYYTWVSDIVFFSWDEISWAFRLPPKILSWFGWLPAGSLCDQFADGCDPDGDNIYNDIILSRSMEWLYQWHGFKIFPTIAVFYNSGMRIDEFNDNALRESVINEMWNITFDASNDFTFITHGANLTKHNVVAADADVIQIIPFADILSDTTNFSGLRLSFGAANLFRTSVGAIYPYLEYQFSFPQGIADRFYTIQWNGRVGEYDVQILLKKPTVEGTVGGDFTVVF